MMRAILHTDLKVVGAVLVDTGLRAQYSLSPDAAGVLRQLVAQPDVPTAVRSIARARHVSETEAKAAVYELYGQLSVFGGMRIEWGRPMSAAARLRVSLQQRLRQPSTLLGFGLAFGRAYGLLAAVATLAFLGLRLIGGPLVPGWYVAVPALLFLSLLLHEAGHVLVAQWCGIRSALVSNLGYMAVVYKRPTTGILRRIALAGPAPTVMLYLAGALFCQSWWLCCMLAGAGLAHGISLLPWVHDGRAIWGRAR